MREITVSLPSLSLSLPFSLSIAVNVIIRDLDCALFNRGS